MLDFPRISKIDDELTSDAKTKNYQTEATTTSQRF